MPADCVSFADLKDAVAAVLAGVSGIGKVATRYGEVETWIERPRPKQAFWQVSVVSAEEHRAGIGAQAFERPMIRLDGFMPWSLEQNTEATWDALVKRVRDRIRTYPTLGNQISGTKSPGLPQTRRHGTGPYSDEKRSLIVHFVTIEFEVDRWFTHTITNTL